MIALFSWYMCDFCLTFKNEYLLEEELAICTILPFGTYLSLHFQCKHTLKSKYCTHTLQMSRMTLEKHYQISDRFYPLYSNTEEYPHH
jgi:glucose-6-phosphate-specific signal transduction histidine kinase